MTFLDMIGRSAAATPDKVAVICGDESITYSSLYRRMAAADTTLPLPLLGAAWDGTFTLHTTGTTGGAKAVTVSQRAVMANTHNLITGHAYSRTLVFIITGDMTHLGCWSKIFPVLATGGTLLILKDGMRGMEAFFDALDLPLGRYGLPDSTLFATFLVPSAIRMLLQLSGNRLAQYADRIDFIETGAAPMTGEDMRRLCLLLPHSRLYNTYASTETGVVATYNYNDGRCLQGCVGRALPMSRVIITPEGRIACHGDTLMSGYGDGSVPMAAGAAFVTGDLGFMDSEGMLHITGREDDIINVGGYKVAPAEVEAAAMEVPWVEDCVCIPTAHPLLGSAPELLVVVREGHELDVRTLARHIAGRMERYKVPVRYRAVSRIERNRNGKIERRKYGFG